MVLSAIWTESLNRDNKDFRSNLLYAVLEKWIFEYFCELFYDDVIYKDGSNLWSYERLKIKA